MSDPNSRSSRVVGWFKNFVRPIVQKTDSDTVLEELDKLASQVEELETSRGKLFPICLLGQAGVGKSTLINTLIADADIVVPSGGGTGPLTANALRVVYGERPSFVVQYHDRERIRNTRLILDGAIYRQSGSKVSLPDVEPGEADEIEALELDPEETKKSRTEEAIGQARLLIAGAQNAQREITYLADALRWVLGEKSKYKMPIVEEDMERLRQVQDALKHGTKESALHFDSADNPDFRRHLRNHACGFLAPLIKEITIHWPSPLLRHSLELIDLPGIGIVGDAYAPITTDYLRNRAKAVMLVTDDRGIRREDVEFLKNSSFLNRLLHASADLTADPVALIVVVGWIDTVAVTNWENDRAMNDGVALKTKVEHFTDQANRCRVDITKRLETYLKDVWNDDTEGKRLVIQSILENLQVFPVSAPQYRLHCSKDPDEIKPFLPDAESTNIISLRSAISQIAQQCLDEQSRRREETNQRFFGQLRARLEVLSAQRSEERQAEAEINKFKQSLDGFMTPLRREFDTRRGGFRNFLRKTVPSQIEAKVKIAATVAHKDIRGDLRKLQGFNWNTLAAAVRKGGTFSGSRHIDLPRDFALCFEAPVAEVWSREILVDVRRETREFADYQSGAVTQVLDWARDQGIRRSTRLLEALVEVVKQNRQQVNAVGKDAVDELRDKVRSELIKKVEGTIRRKCQKFVDDGKNSGAGVKGRILELIEQLAELVVAAAADPAAALLVEKFKEVDKEILTAFREHSDPLDEAADALIQRQEKTIQRDDTQLANAIEAALSAMPSAEKIAA